eukprot:Skav227727  [mRNA]  locus=scaffold3499:3141:6572:- [translate_table: standard]
MTKTHAKGLPEHRGVNSGLAMSAAARRRVRCHAALPPTDAQGRWAKLRGRMKEAHELLASRLQRVLAGIDAWLLQSPLWFMCVGLGLLGELCHWLLWLYIRRYYPVFINAPNRLVRPKLRKVRVPTWVQLLKKPGPWRQACQRCLRDTIVEKARMVGPQRICGVKGARGLGNCFRAAPLKSVGGHDNARIRKCVFLIQHRWNIHVPRTREIAVQSAAKSSCPQNVDAKGSQSTPPAGHGGQFGNQVLKVVKDFLDKWNSRSKGVDEDVETSNGETIDEQSEKQNHFGLPQWAWDLRGGMPMGSHVTNRKRQEKRDNVSLASALGDFLSQWQKQYPQARKRQKTSSKVFSDEWYDETKDQYQYGNDYWNYEAPPENSDETLVQTLLVFLNKCQQQKTKDDEVGEHLQKTLWEWEQAKGPARRVKLRSDSWAGQSGKATVRPQSQPQIAQGPPISAVNPGEWSMTMKLIHKKAYIQQIADGKQCECNLVCIRNLDDFWEIQDMRKAMECFSPISVLIDGKVPLAEGRHVKVSVKRGQSRMKLEELTFACLGLASLAPKPRDPKTINLQKYQPDPKVSIRVCALAHYREAFLPQGEWDRAKSILIEMASWQVTPVSTIVGGTWEWKKVDKCHTLVGHLRVSPKVAAALESQSGKRAIFVTTTGVGRRPEKVKWLKKPVSMTSDNYLRESMNEAISRNQSWKFQMGGGSDLGVLYLPTDNIPKKHIHVHVEGVPRSWDATHVTTFMEEQGWQQVEPITWRNFRRQVKWILKAQPPEDSYDPTNSTCTWHYVDGVNQSLEIHVTKAEGRFPKPQHVQPAAPPKRRFQTQKQTHPTHEVPDTQMDDELESNGKDEEKTVNDDGHDQQNERPRSRSPARTKPKKLEFQEATETAKPEWDEIADLINNKGFEEIDFGGNGDCGFRAIGCALDYFKDPAQVRTPEQCQRAGAKLRSQVVTHCRRHDKSFLPFFAPDPEAAGEDPSLQAQSSFKAWLDSLGQPRTWIDGVAMRALAIKTGHVIVIWKKETKKAPWRRTTLAPTFDQGWAKAAKGSKPIVVLLKDNHYTWLKPPKHETIPNAWLKETAFPDRKELQGAAKSSSSLATPSVHTISLQGRSARSSRKPNGGSRDMPTPSAFTRHSPKLPVGVQRHH